jgi:hypothetical protein
MHPSVDLNVARTEGRPICAGQRPNAFQRVEILRDARRNASGAEKEIAKTAVDDGCLVIPEAEPRK